MKKRGQKTQKPPSNSPSEDRKPDSGLTQNQKKTVELIEKKVLDKIHDDHWREKMQHWDGKKAE